MARWENCLNKPKRGENGACSEYNLKCVNDNGGYGLICDMLQELELTDEEYLMLYGKKRE